MKANQANILFTKLLEEEALLHFSTMREVTEAGGIRRISPVGAKPNREHADYTIGRYLDDLERQNYALLFNDLSYAQIDYFFARNEIKAHRLVYVPCPFALDGEIGFDELEYVQLNMQTGGYQVRLRGALRFDFSDEEVDEDHPFCHLHMINEFCRLPVKSYLKIGDFLRLLYRNFHRPEFAKVDGLLPGLRRPAPDLLRPNDLEGFYVDWLQ